MSTNKKTAENEVQTPVIDSPDFDDLALLATDAPVATADVPKIEGAVGKVIPKFQRYQMFADGQIGNRSTEQIMEITEDPKNPGVLQCRLTNDEGKRMYVKTDALYLQLYSPDIEGKTAKADKPEKGIRLSKSMKIYLLSKAGLSVNQICETPTGDDADPVFAGNHVRSSIKDYGSAANAAKREKAERIASELERLGTPFVIPAIKAEAAAYTVQKLTEVDFDEDPIFEEGQNAGISDEEDNLFFEDQII